MAGTDVPKAFAMNEDGTPKDPLAFQRALRANEELVRLSESETPEMQQALWGEDMRQFSRAIQKFHGEHQRSLAREMHVSAEVQRARNRYPGNATYFYKRMHHVGYEYGPSFQLLTAIRTTAPLSDPLMMGPAPPGF